jgi:hypothetical protein
MDPYGCILGFIDRSSYFFFKVAPQLYSRGRVDPVPDPLLSGKSGRAGNLTRTSGSVARNFDSRKPPLSPVALIAGNAASCFGHRDVRTINFQFDGEKINSGNILSNFIAVTFRITIITIIIVTMSGILT